MPFKEFIEVNQKQGQPDKYNHTVNINHQALDIQVIYDNKYTGCLNSANSTR